MITFEKISTFAGVSYACQAEDRCIGYLHPCGGEFYAFYPNHVPGTSWPSLILKEIVFKLEALNDPITQKLLAEAIEDNQGFTD